MKVESNIYDAVAALSQYANRTGIGKENWDTKLVDMLTDLMHAGIATEDVWKRALANWEEERCGGTDDEGL